MAISIWYFRDRFISRECNYSLKIIDIKKRRICQNLRFVLTIPLKAKKNVYKEISTYAVLFLVYTKHFCTGQ